MCGLLAVSKLTNLVLCSPALGCFVTHYPVDHVLLLVVADFRFNFSRPIFRLFHNSRLRSFALSNVSAQSLDSWNVSSFLAPYLFV